MKTIVGCLNCEFSFFAIGVHVQCPACGLIMQRDTDGTWKRIRYSPRAC